ncbi:MAG: hypothetical protein K9M99_02835 [Candidatus Cloacimonetes bacterium]|nr:hypothetical protein [Candidatus Cloacimonadota bacterium]
MPIEPLPLDAKALLTSPEDIAKEVLVLFSNYPTHIAKSILEKCAGMLEEPPSKMTVADFLKF